MIEASIELSLSKDHTIIRHNVTPIEALLLTAEHHKNAGGSPIRVIGTPVEIETKRFETQKVKTGTRKEGDGMVDVFTEKKVDVIGTRSDDDELNRLRSRYAYNKVQAVANSCKVLPTTFEKAIEMGVGISMPQNRMMEMKLL